MSSPSYRDEKAVVDYFVTRLEERLAGRHETETLNTLPSDHCQLGVLVPWSIDPNAADPMDAEDEADESTGDPSASDDQQKGKPENDGQVPAALSSTPASEPFSAIEEAARRPPSFPAGSR